MILLSLQERYFFTHTHTHNFFPRIYIVARIFFIQPIKFRSSKFVLITEIKLKWNNTIFCLRVSTTCRMYALPLPRRDSKYKWSFGSRLEANKLVKRQNRECRKEMIYTRILTRLGVNNSSRRARIPCNSIDDMRNVSPVVTVLLTKGRGYRICWRDPKENSESVVCIRLCRI